MTPIQIKEAEDCMRLNGCVSCMEELLEHYRNKASRYHEALWIIEGLGTPLMYGTPIPKAEDVANQALWIAKEALKEAP